MFQVVLAVHPGHVWWGQQLWDCRTEREWMNKWFSCMLCGLRHRTGLYGDSSTWDLLALPVSSRALDSSPRVARKLPFILLNLSLLGDFSRNDLLFPASSCPFITPTELGSHVVCRIASTYWLHNFETNYQLTCVWYMCRCSVPHYTFLVLWRKWTFALPWSG